MECGEEGADRALESLIGWSRTDDRMRVVEGSESV